VTQLDEAEWAGPQTASMLQPFLVRYWREAVSLILTLLLASLGTFYVVKFPKRVILLLPLCKPYTEAVYLDLYPL
jgi:hypothetical protein